MELMPSCPPPSRSFLPSWNVDVLGPVLCAGPYFRKFTVLGNCRYKALGLILKFVDGDMNV